MQLGGAPKGSFWTILSEGPKSVPNRPFHNQKSFGIWGPPKGPFWAILSDGSKSVPKRPFHNQKSNEIGGGLPKGHFGALQCYSTTVV